MIPMYRYLNSFREIGIHAWMSVKQQTSTIWVETSTMTAQHGTRMLFISVSQNKGDAEGRMQNGDVLVCTRARCWECC